MKRKRQIVFVAVYLFVALIGLGSTATSVASTCDLDHTQALKLGEHQPIIFTMVKINPAPRPELP